MAEPFGFLGEFGSRKFAGDYEPPDLACAGPYFIELGIPPKFLDGEFKAVPIAAMNLHRLITDPGGRFGGEEDSRRGLLSEFGAFASSRRSLGLLRRPVDHKPRGLGTRVHIGELLLHHLEGGDGLAELLHVRRQNSWSTEGLLGHADRAAREHYPLDVQSTGHHVDTVVLYAHEVFSRHRTILEDELGRRRTPHPAFFKLPGH